MTVYNPGKDSLLLGEQLEELKIEGKTCLEIGTGSGFLAEKMLKLGAEKVEAVDVNPEAVKEASGRLEGSERVEVYQSDLFEEVKGIFDLVVFNPPYLPEEESEIGDEEIWSGGEGGVEVLEKFLESVDDYLSEDGFCIFIASSLSDIDHLKESFSVLETEKLWFEELYVLASK